ncbi:hypothetical protein AB2L27_16715 [Kineococcus sp. LSe6-4]|uniref:Antitoxin n=1 Tax=Kineococcus halophytocola TaxID=3234027 RepID=A0ABV4H4B5_9ACTN
MAGLVGKLGQFLKSPEGQRVAQQAQRALKDPATRRTLTDAVSKFRGGSSGSGTRTPR